MFLIGVLIYFTISRADSRFSPSQWETSLQSNAVSHSLGANLVPALIPHTMHSFSQASLLSDGMFKWKHLWLLFLKYLWTRSSEYECPAWVDHCHMLINSSVWNYSVGIPWSQAIVWGTSTDGSWWQRCRCGVFQDNMTIASRIFLTCLFLLIYHTSQSKGKLCILISALINVYCASVNSKEYFKRLGPIIAS